MDYLLQQIFWFLLAAFVVGFIVGWLVKPSSRGQASSDAAAQYQSQLAELERKNAELESRLARADDGDPGAATRFADLEQRNAQLEARIAEAPDPSVAEGLRGQIADLEKRNAELEAKLAAAGADHGTPVEEIEGIGKGFGTKLRNGGIETTEELLAVCATDEGVERVRQLVDLDEETVRSWATMADLIRVDGIGGQWAELLWRCDVRTVQDLAERDAEGLSEKMREVNEEEHRVAELPGPSRVAKFIQQAGRLDRRLG